jgi:hypothetical protein
MQLVHNWKSLWRAWSMWFATLGLALPELLQLLADNTSLLLLSDGHKNWIRIACLVGVIVFRPIQQRAMEPKK